MIAFWEMGGSFYKTQLLLLHCNCSIYGPRRENTCLRVFANNTGADQPALISVLVIHFLESNVCKLATGEIKCSRWSL